MDDNKALRVPEYSTLSEDRLADPTDTEFAHALQERALTVANDLYDPDAYTVVDLPHEERVRREIAYLQRRSFAEWYFGTVTPARQISMLPDSEVVLKLRLARQIADEIRHHDVFAAGVKRRGGEWRVQRYQLPPNLRKMLEAQVNGMTAAELAAANQYTGEVVLSVQDREEGNVLRVVAAVDIMADIENIEADEPAHIAIGRDLVRRYARDIAARRQMVVAQETFLAALIGQHTTELESLGLQRVRPLPEFSPGLPWRT